MADLAMGNNDRTTKPAEEPLQPNMNAGEAEKGLPKRTIDRQRRTGRALRVAGAVLLCLAAFKAYWSFVSGTGWANALWCPNKDWCKAATPGTESDGQGRGDMFLLGVGKADITGPVVEINLMGYADPKQVGSGLRQRLYSRAFIVGSLDADKADERFVYLVLDTQSGDTAVRYGILEGLRSLGAEYSVYGHHNVAVTGTHSHSGPGGWLNYLLPQITSKGFDRQGFRAIIDGAVLSIQRAHEKLQPGYLSVATAPVRGANINRSLFAYLANPEAERARYNQSAGAGSDFADDDGGDDGSVDKNMTLLRFERASDGRDMGVLTWFPTHGTSMLGNNSLVTGDNKGVAAYLFERSIRGVGGGDGTVDEDFVAGFSQANVGDTSPNVLGAWCEDGSGLPCSLETSTCAGGKAQTCHARGPRFREDNTGTASCFEIGRRQFETARQIYDDMALRGRGQPVRGGWVRSFHRFHNMSGYAFQLSNGSLAHTCPAALGYSFAAGTSDGPGAVNFTQHDSDPSNTSPVWRAVSHLLKAPSAEQHVCHGAKPILMDVGELSTPYAWTPNIVDVQVFRAGQLFIIVSPGEATTMAGRRWKEAVAGAVGQWSKGEDSEEKAKEVPVVVLGGPANSYTHYITTEEEYGIQRYEGASTLYGPHTLAAYIDVTLAHLPYLAASESSRPPLPPQDPAIFPPDNSNRSLSFITGVVLDGAPLGKKFGDVLEDVQSVYRRGTGAGAGAAGTGAGTGVAVTCRFVGANPRNNLRLEGTFAAVEMRTDDGSWTVARDDSDWSLVYRWTRKSQLLGTSEAEIVWEVEDWAEPGAYRIHYYLDAKSLGGAVTAYEGVSSVFLLE